MNDSAGKDFKILLSRNIKQDLVNEQVESVYVKIFVMAVWGIEFSYEFVPIYDVQSYYGMNTEEVHPCHNNTWHAYSTMWIE